MRFSGSVEGFRVWLELVEGYNAFWWDKPLSDWIG